MAILFDLDGTLVDTAGDILTAINNLCLELGCAIPDQTLLKNNTSFGLQKLLSIALNRDFSNLLDQVKDQNIELKALKTRFRYFYNQTNFINSVLFPGIKELLDNLKTHKIKIAVVTNKNYEFAQLILKKLNILEYLDCLVTADMVKHPKPSPDSVLLAIERLNVVPSQCLFIGDAEQDIIAGNLAGVKTVSALYGYISESIDTSNWGATYSVNFPEEIYLLINKLYLN